MKRLIIVAAIAVSAALSAQNLQTFKQKLAASVQVDSLTTIKQTVIVTEHDDAANLAQQGANKQTAAVNGFRIMIFMSNSQTARTEALAARDTLAVRMPDQQSYVTYENPYFKVAAGNCTSKEEALVLLEKIKRDFPKAFIMRENIPLEELAK